MAGTGWVRVGLCATLAVGCRGGEALTPTPDLPDPYSIGTQIDLAGGTAADDVWVSTAGPPANWFHFDGAAWSTIPLDDLKAALGLDYPQCATGTAGREAIYCGQNSHLLRVETSGAVSDASAGLPAVATEYGFSRVGSTVYLSLGGTEDPSTDGIYRLDGDTWVRMPLLPGKADVIVRPDGRVLARGTYPYVGPDIDSDHFFASLDGSDWTVSRFPHEPLLDTLVRPVLLAADDAWGVLEVGGVVAQGSGAYGPRDWTLAHYDGTGWGSVVVALPPTLASSEVAIGGFAVAPSDGGGLALLYQDGEDIVMTEWDGTEVGATTTVGHYEWPANLGIMGAVEYEGQLTDGTHVFTNPLGRDVLLGTLP